jgi:hypothetical protein
MSDPQVYGRPVQRAVSWPPAAAANASAPETLAPETLANPATQRPRLVLLIAGGILLVALVIAVLLVALNATAATNREQQISDAYQQQLDASRQAAADQLAKSSTATDAGPVSDAASGAPPSASASAASL